jgi:hypothetical protein
MIKQIYWKYLNALNVHLKSQQVKLFVYIPKSAVFVEVAKSRTLRCSERAR